MSALLELLKSTVSGAFSQQGAPWFLVAVILATVGLLVRLFIERKRLTFEEVYNSKIGFHRPFEPNDSEPPQAVLKNFNNVSILVLRIWNSGRASIETTDFRQPLELDFSDRFIVDFRVSTPRPPSVATAEDVGHSWLVSRAEDGLGAPRARMLAQNDLRQSLPASLYSEQEGGLNETERKARKKLLIPPLSLGRSHSLKVVVCLREDRDLEEEEPAAKNYQLLGELAPGKITNQDKRRTRPSLTQALSGVLFLSLILLIVSVVRPTPPFFCAQGDLRVVGSSAFEPTVQYAADRYSSECPGGANISLQMASSLDGVRQLRGATKPVISFSDGVAAGTDGFTREPIAVLTYNVVVNSSAGIKDLTTTQIRDIYAGKITNWEKLGGPNLEIRLVGRNADSGSRQAFERYVLGGPEGALSSNFCDSSDRGFPAAIIRCERSDTKKVLQEVNTVHGAIGYADASAIGAFTNAVPQRIDGLQGSFQFLTSGYNFWTVEYVYSKGGAAQSSLSENLMSYMRSDQLARKMHEDGYIPCLKSDGLLEPLCQTPR